MNKTRINNLWTAALFFLLFISLASAYDINDFKPDWFSDYTGDRNSVFENFWYSLQPFESKYDVNENADVYSWYNNTFFGLAGWEREVCMIDTSSDVRTSKDAVSQEQSSNIYTTTLTLAAKRERGFNSTYIYEASWYIAPYNADAYYRVYFVDGKDKHFIAGRKGDNDNDWVPAPRYFGSSGYDAFYLKKLYKKAVIEYRSVNNEQSDQLEVKIIKKELV